MIVSARSNGGGSYGLRVLGRKLGLWFRPEWETVTVKLPDDDSPVKVKISDSFWTGCPYLRSPRFREFLVRNGLLPWPKNRPPHFELVSLGSGAFELRWLERRERQPRLRLFTS